MRRIIGTRRFRHLLVVGAGLLCLCDAECQDPESGVAGLTEATEGFEAGTLDEALLVVEQLEALAQRFPEVDEIKELGNHIRAVFRAEHALKDAEKAAEVARKEAQGKERSARTAEEPSRLTGATDSTAAKKYRLEAARLLTEAANNVKEAQASLSRALDAASIFLVSLEEKGQIEEKNQLRRALNLVAKRANIEIPWANIQTKSEPTKEKLTAFLAGTTWKRINKKPSDEEVTIKFSEDGSYRPSNVRPGTWKAISPTEVVRGNAAETFRMVFSDDFTSFRQTARKGRYKAEFKLISEDPPSMLIPSNSAQAGNTSQAPHLASDYIRDNRGTDKFEFEGLHFGQKADDSIKIIKKINRIDQVQWKTPQRWLTATGKRPSGEVRMSFFFHKNRLVSIENAEFPGDHALLGDWIRKYTQGNKSEIIKSFHMAHNQTEVMKIPMTDGVGFIFSVSNRKFGTEIATGLCCISNSLLTEMIQTGWGPEQSMLLRQVNGFASGQQSAGSTKLKGEAVYTREVGRNQSIVWFEWNPVSAFKEVVRVKDVSFYTGSLVSFLRSDFMFYSAFRNWPSRGGNYMKEIPADSLSHRPGERSIYWTSREGKSIYLDAEVLTVRW